MRQVILNSSGWSLTIFIQFLSSSAAAGGWGSGFAVREYKAVGPTSSSPHSQRNSWAHFSLSPLALNSSHLLHQAISFNMPIFATPRAYSHSEVLQEHFPSLWSQQGSLLLQVGLEDWWVYPKACWLLLVALFTPTLLYRCQISRNLNFLNSSREKLLTEPDHL